MEKMGWVFACRGSFYAFVLPRSKIKTRSKRKTRMQTSGQLVSPLCFRACGKKFGGETENRCKPPARIVAVFPPSFPIKEKDKKYRQLPHIKGVMLSSLSEKALA